MQETIGLINILIVEDNIRCAQSVAELVEGGEGLQAQLRKICPEIGIVTMTNYTSRELEIIQFERVPCSRSTLL